MNFSNNVGLTWEFRKTYNFICQSSITTYDLALHFSKNIGFLNKVQLKLRINMGI